MFAGEYQGGAFVEVLGTQGQHPLSQWKVTGPQKGVQKTYDKALKGYVFVSGSGCKMALPRDERSALGLTQPYLLLQLEITAGGPFNVELALTDAGGTRRRLLLSSSFSEVKCSTLHSQVPLTSVPRELWVNLVLPLGELLPVLFKAGGAGGGYRSLDSVSLAGGCRLRRIATMRDAPQLLLAAAEGPEGGIPVAAKPMDFPPGLDIHTLALDPRSMSFVSCTASAAAPVVSNLRSSLHLSGGLGGGAGGGGPGGSGAGQAGGGFGVVGTSTGTNRRPTTLTVAVAPPVGPGLSGGVVPVHMNGRTHGSPALAAGGSRAAHGGQGGYAPLGAGAGGTSVEEEGELLLVREDPHAAGAVSSLMSHHSGGLVAGPHGSLSGPTTPTGGRGSNGPPSPWAVARGEQQHPPSRLGRSPNGPNGSAAPPSMLPPAPGAIGRPPRAQGIASNGSSGPAALGGAGALHGGAQGHGDEAHRQGPGEGSPFGNRRAISAQTTIRSGVGEKGGVGLPEIPGASGAGGGGGGSGGKDPPLPQGVAAAQAAGSVGKPRSPPWPRAALSKRAQSGPARISTEALAQGLGETQAPFDAPMSPSLMPRPGRRYLGGNFPPTIVENDPSTSGAGTPANRSPARSPARGSRPTGLRSSVAAPGALTAPGGLTVEPPGSPGLMLPMLRPVRTNDLPLSPSGAPGAPGSAHSNGGGVFTPLASVLMVRGGLDASIDFGGQAPPGADGGGSAGGGAPCSPSVLSAMRMSSMKHRYGNGGGGGHDGGGGASGDLDSDSDRENSTSPYANVPATVPRMSGAAAAAHSKAGAGHGLRSPPVVPAGAGGGAKAGAPASLGSPGLGLVPVPHPPGEGAAAAGGGAGGGGGGGAAARKAAPAAAAWVAADGESTPKHPGTPGGAKGAPGSTKSSPGPTPTKSATPASQSRFAGSSPSRQRSAEPESEPPSAASTPIRPSVAANRAARQQAQAAVAAAAAAAVGMTPPSPARRMRRMSLGPSVGEHPHSPGPGAARAAAAPSSPAVGAARSAPRAPAPGLPPLAGGGPGAGGAGAGAGGARPGRGVVRGRGRGRGTGTRVRRGSDGSVLEPDIDVEESVTLGQGMWGGFGVDEEDEVLGSRHFREDERVASDADEAVGGSKRASGAQLVIPSGPSLSHGLAGYGGNGSDASTPGTPLGAPAPWAPGHDPLLSPPLHPHTTAPLSPPIRRSTQRSVQGLGGEHGGEEGAGVGAGGPLGVFGGFFAQRSSRDDDGGLGGLGGARASVHIDAQLHALLDEDALLEGGHRNVDDYDHYDWTNVDKRETPEELRTPHRAFTPPVVPASKALGVALPPGAHGAGAAGGRGGGRNGGGGGAGRGGRGGAQMLRVGAGSAGVVAAETGEAMLDLVYDPVLNCYFDSTTGQYYELKN